MVMLLLGQKRVSGARSGRSFHDVPRHFLVLGLLVDHDLQLTSALGQLPSSPDEPGSRGVEILEDDEELVDEGTQDVEEHDQRQGNEVEVLLVHRGMWAFNVAPGVMMMVMMVVAVTDAGRGSVAVLSLGHAQLLR